jgi:two-component system, chemotaxis family, CheB/CheR fusion protein
LPGTIAVLDAQGVIGFVNRAWREFAAHNGDPGMIATGPGANCLAVCRHSAPEDEHARQVLKGLLEVLFTSVGRATADLGSPEVTAHCAGAA